MSGPASREGGAFAADPWNGGIATFEATGADRREALEAGLRAVLALAIEDSTGPSASADTRSAPIRGEGADLAALFADLLDDLLEQLADFGVLHDVTLDGVLRQDQGGFIGWGYVAVPARRSGGAALPRLHGLPEVREEEPRRIVVRATLARD